MKRFLLFLFCAGVLCSGVAFAPRSAQAQLVAARSKATPTPSPLPAPIPTASPEPPNIAIPRLEAILQKNPNDRDAMLQLAGQMLGIGQPQATLQLTQRLLQLGEKNAQVYYMDGSAQQAVGNLQGAISDMEAASTQEPTNLGILAGLSQLYLSTNPPRLADAERVALRAVTFNATDPRALSNLGIVYASEQKWDQARKEFEQAFALNPKDISPLIQEAQTWVSQNTIPNAQAVIERAIAADPKSVQALVFRADLYAKQNNIPAAGQAFDDAAAAATDDAEKASIMVRKALMYATAKQQAQAQATFEAAIKQYPSISSLHTAFGEYWLANRQTANAERELVAAVRADKTDTHALLDLAQLKMSQNRTSDAIGYLKQLAQVAPSPQTFAMLGQAYISSHDYKQARTACAQSFQMQRTPDTLACIAGSDYNLKNYKESAQIFDIIDKNAKGYADQHPDYLYMMGVDYTQTKQRPKALAAYRRLLKLMRPGTKEYKQIKADIAALLKNEPSAPKKKRG